MRRDPARTTLVLLVLGTLALLGIVMVTRAGTDGGADRRGDPGTATRPAPTARTGEGTPGGAETPGGAAPSPAADVPTAVTPTYPVPTRPPSGCPPAGGGTVTVLVRSSGPRPACAAVRPGDVIRVRNELDTEIVFIVGEAQETIGPGDEMALGRGGDVLDPGTNYFWMVGLPDLSGILELDG